MSALVLIHGFTGHPAAWDEALGETTAPVLSLSPLGHDGAGAGEVTDFEAEVDRLAAQIATSTASSATGARGLHLCGYSLGARLALGLLVRHGGLFARATLLGVNPGLEDETARAARIDDDEAWAQRLLRDGLEPFLAAWQAQPVLASALDRVPAAARARMDTQRRRHDPAGLVRCLRTLSLGRMPSYWRALPSIPQPVRLVTGCEDDKFVRLAAQAAALLPRSSRVVVARCGHNVPLEQPLALRPLLTPTQSSL